MWPKRIALQGPPPDSDKRQSKLIKWLVNFLVDPWQTAVVLGDWKVAVTYPIFKKRGPEVVANYQPVSLALVVCKAFEQIFKRTIPFFLCECNDFRPVGLIS